MATPHRATLFAARDFTRIVIVATISILSLASSFAALGVVRDARASFGFGLNGLVVTAVGPHTPAARAGIGVGDRLSPLTPFATRLRLLWYDVYRPDQSEHITVERNGRSRSLILTAVPHRPPYSRTAEILIVLRMLAYAGFIAIGALLVLLRPARFTWGFFGCCVGLATFPSFIGWSLTVINPVLGFGAFVVWTCAADVANVGFLAFALRFPTDRADGWRQTAWRTLPYWLLAFLALDAASITAWYAGVDLPGVFAWLPEVLGFAAWVLGTAALAATYHAQEPRNRKRLQWAIVGSSLGYLAWYVDKLLVGLGLAVAGHIIGFATVALPLSVAFAVLRHRVVDVRFVVSRAVAYSLLASLLVALFALSSWVTAALLLQSRAQLFVQICLALIVGVWLSRTLRRVERTLEGALFRRLRRAEGEFTQAAIAIGSTMSHERLERLLTEIPLDALDLDFVCVYRRGPSGAFVFTAGAGDAGDRATTLAPSDPLVALLGTARVPSAHAAGALALPVGLGTLHAIVLFGAHRNGLDVDLDEIELLRRFTAAADPAYNRIATRVSANLRLAALLRPPEALADRAFATELGALILDELSPEDAAIIAACATLPRAAGEDIAFLVDRAGAGERLAELAATTALVARAGDGTYTVHALLRPLLAERGASRARSDILRCAVERMRTGACLRACELYLAAGDRPGALAAAARCARNGSNGDGLAAMVSSLLTAATFEELAEFPELLLVRAWSTWPVEDDAALRSATFDVLERAPNIAAHTREALETWLAYGLFQSGDLPALTARIDQFGEPAALVARTLVAGKRGAAARYEILLRQLDPTRRSRDGVPLPLLEAILAEYPLRRDADDAADFNRALPGARDVPCRLVVLAEIVFRHWLAGDEQLCARVANALLDAAQRGNIHALDHIARNALGTDSAPPPASYPRFAAYAWMMQACRAATPLDAVRQANRAREAAISAHEPFLAALASIVLAECEAAKSDDHLQRAAGFAREIENEPLIAAVAALATNVEPAGMIAPLVQRVRASASYAAPLTIDLATASVRRGPEIVAASGRELALLLALAGSSQPVGTATLIDMLWPDLDETAGSRALQTCVYRARQRLSDASAIESVAQGYRLASECRVDLREGERLVATLQTTSCEDPFVRLRLEALARHFGRPRPPGSLGWEWFDPLERRMLALARATRLHLADHYLRSGEHTRALAYAREAIDADDLDERGCELAMRAYLAAGALAEARRELRLYREALARECGEEPPAALVALLPNGVTVPLAHTTVTTP